VFIRHPGIGRQTVRSAASWRVVVVEGDQWTVDGVDNEGRFGAGDARTCVRGEMRLIEWVKRPVFHDLPELTR